MSKLSYKTLFIIFFFLLILTVIVFRFVLPKQKVSAAWWNESWMYRKAISVVNNTNYDAVNIPYKISLDTQILINSNKLQADADDIRIVNSDGVIIRSQVEKNTLNTVNTKIWFEVTAKSGSTSYYYIYYGNSLVAAPIFNSDINTFTSTSNTTTIEMKDGFGYSTSISNGGIISDIRKNSADLGVDGNINNSSSYPGSWWSSSALNQTILNSVGPIFVEVNYSAGTTGSYSSYGTNIKIFDNGFAETQIFTTYNTSGSENFYYYLSFLNGTRNSVWVNGSGTLVDQDADSGTLTEASLGQNWFGQRWTASGIYGGTIITKNGSDWINGGTSTRASYYQTNYSYTQPFTSGSSREVRFGVFAGDGGLTEMQQKGANYGALGLSLATEELSPAPIAYWKFDEGSGVNTKNSIKTEFSSTLTGSTLPVWQNESSCISGKCLYFNGEYGQVETSFSQDILKTGKETSSWTLAAWVKPNGTQTGSERMVIGRSGCHGGIYAFANDFRFAIKTDACWTNAKEIIYTPPNMNDWHYLVGVYNNRAMYFYVDGKLIGSDTFSATMTAYGDNFYIGGIPSFIFKGTIDEPKIYPYARTADQIKLDYNSHGAKKGSSVNLGIKSSTAPQLSSQLLDHWKFDNFLNNSVSSRSSATGAIGGSAYFFNNGQKNQSLDFTELYNGNFIYVSSNTFQDTTKNWATNSLVGYQFATDYGPNSEYCRGTITSNTSTNITFSSSCASWSGNKYYRIKKSIYVSAPVPSHPSDKTSISLWFKSNISQSARIIRADNELVHLTIGSGNVSVGALSYVNSVNYNTNPHDGKWHHLSLVYDGSTQKIYYDGILRGSNSLSGALQSGGNLTIGARNDGYQEFFNGFIDEVKVYNTALTSEEIKQDYNQGSAIQFGSTNQTIGNTTTSLEYCIPGDTSYCANPVAEWNFEENIGTIVYDTSGNNNNGIINNATWTVGKKNTGASIKFNGETVSSYLFTSYPSNGPTSYTAEAWIKPSSISGSGEHSTYGYTIMAASIDGSRYPVWITLRNGEIRASAFVGSLAYTETVGANIQTNNWYHIAVSAIQNSTATIYINGIGKTSFTAGNIAWNTTDKLTIADLRPTRNISFNGSIDHVKIYDYARTPAQVAYDYNKGAPIGWWKFDECQGLTAFDSSGIGYTGSISIGPSGTQNTVGTCQVGTSAAWTNGASGKYNGSLSFDGQDDYMSAPVSVGGSEATVAFWVKNILAGTGPYLFRSNAGTRTYIGVSGSNVYFTKGSPTAVSLGSYSVTPSKWNHILLKWWTSSGVSYAQAYINGQAVSVGTSFTDNSQGTFITIAGFSNNGTQNASGQFDDVRVYNYALTSDQVKTVYNNGAINFQ